MRSDSDPDRSQIDPDPRSDRPEAVDTLIFFFSLQSKVLVTLGGFLVRLFSRPPPLFPRTLEPRVGGARFSLPNVSGEPSQLLFLGPCVCLVQEKLDQDRYDISVFGILLSTAVLNIAEECVSVVPPSARITVCMHAWAPVDKEERSRGDWNVT